MRIAVDMENVLADPKTWFLRQYNARHGTDYRIGDVTHWDWVHDEIEFEEFMKTINEGWRRHRQHIEPVEDNLAHHFTALIESTDATVDIVTARTGVEDEMQSWLSDQGITRYEEFISISPFETKATLGYDYYIDDNPNLAERLGESQLQYLVGWPWNRLAENHPRTISVDHFSEAVQDICRSQIARR